MLDCQLHRSCQFVFMKKAPKSYAGMVYSILYQSIYSYSKKTAVDDVLVSLSGRQTMFFVIEIFGRCLVVNPFSYLVDTDCFFFVLTGSEKTSFLNATQNPKPRTPIGSPPYVYSSDCIRSFDSKIRILIG